MIGILMVRFSQNLVITDIFSLSFCLAFGSCTCVSLAISIGWTSSSLRFYVSLRRITYSLIINPSRGPIYNDQLLVHGFSLWYNLIPCYAFSQLFLFICLWIHILYEYVVLTQTVHRSRIFMLHLANIRWLMNLNFPSFNLWLINVGM
jgi:hypothetical protein